VHPFVVLTHLNAGKSLSLCILFVVPLRLPYYSLVKKQSQEKKIWARNKGWTGLWFLDPTFSLSLTFSLFLYVLYRRKNEKKTGIRQCEEGLDAMHACMHTPFSMMLTNTSQHNKKNLLLSLLP
jgi:hypothetical protein